MSYINTSRLHFAGGFFSDPSTVNNDPAHYNNAVFDRSKLWLLQTANSANGWWNPEGANLFKLLNVVVTSAIGLDGLPLAAGSDPVLTLKLESRDGRSAAKMVDLDPDQQLVSMIFGLTVALVDELGRTLMLGTVEPAPFSDIWSRGRGNGNFGNDERACVFYQTVVHVTQWGDLSGSPYLQQLRQAAPDSLLSLRFQLDGYSMTGPEAGRKHTGRIVGTLGGAVTAEPRHWQPGRHLGPTGDIPTFSASPGFRPPANFAVAVLDKARGKVRIDLGNALTIDVTATPPPNSPVRDQGQLSLVGVKPDGTEVMLSGVPYGGANWYEQTAGIVELPAGRALSAQELQSFQSLPLRLISERPAQGGQPAQKSVLLEERLLHVRADMFVARMNSGDTVEFSFQASSLGKPLAGAVIQFGHYIPTNDPRYPENGVTFPASVACDADGKATAIFTAADPGAIRFFFTENDVREHVDGMAYRIAYTVNGQIPANPSDFLSILVWNDFKADEPPTWHGSMRPIFEQFGNLYPFMTTRGRGIGAPPWLDLADYQQVSANSDKIIEVFELAETHPHYMPVTRDLSRSKREAMLRWLKNPGPDGKPLLGTALPHAVPAIAANAEATAPGDAVPAGAIDHGSKTLAGQRLQGRKFDLQIKH